MEINQKGLDICPHCNSGMWIRTSQSQKNPNRQYYKCSKFSCEEWIGFVDEFDNYKAYQFPRLIKAKNINGDSVSDMQDQEADTSFFQSIGTLPAIVRKFGYSDQFQTTIRSMSQWRLDFYKYKKIKIDGQLEGIISQALNILNRSTLTFATPRIKRKLENFYEYDLDDIHPKELMFSAMNFLNNPNYHFILNQDNKIFGSSIEYNFWKKFKEDCKDIGGLNLIPQMSLNSISSNKNSLDERVVDFYLWNSLNENKPTIIEIDGSQHENQKTIDSSRDNIAKLSGIKTIRINKNLLESGSNIKDMLNISNNRNYVNELENYKEIDNNQKVADLIRISKFVYQIQIAVLKSILNNKINFNKSNYLIGVFIPNAIRLIENLEIEDLINQALLDIQDLLSNLSEIYNFKIKIPSLKYIKFNSANYDKTDINIVNTSNNNDHLKDYVISDISIPLQVGYIQQYPTVLQVKNPDKKICLWFLDYLFGHKDFEMGQWESVKQIFEGKDSIAIMRTGAGKSLIFQFTGILNSGISIIISPLVSLINDQIFNLKSEGYDKVISFDNKYLFKDDMARNISGGLFKFIYVTPERFQIEDFRQIIKSTLIKYQFSNASIDEAHCISEWGHDFRTSYMRLAHTIRKLCKTKNKTPVITALTATAGEHVLNDMKRELDINIILKFGSMARPEINYKIIKSKSKDKPEALRSLSKELPKFFEKEFEEFYKKNEELTYCGIIYTPHVDNIYGVVDVATMWSNYTITDTTIFCGQYPEAYSLDGKQWEEQKKENANNFRRNQIITMISTNSFGMGINKQNVRHITHYVLPRSMESFYQESGRAGRSKNSRLNKSLSTVIFSDDFPIENDKILNPGTPLEESRTLLDASQRDAIHKDDDIGKTMFFHTNSFQGVETDQNNMKKYLEKIYKLSEENKSFVDLPWTETIVREGKDGEQIKDTEDFQSEIGLVVYRLTILGIIEDYTVDYSNEIFNIILSELEGGKIIQKLREYIYNFDPGTDMIIVDKISEDFKEHKDYMQLVYASIDTLIEFLYKNLESSRRRSTYTIRSTFLEALERPEEKQSEFIQERLQAYFDDLDDKDEAFLEKIVLYDESAINDIYRYIKNTPSTKVINIGGSIDRYLDAQPGNFWLYLLRFGVEIATENFSMNRVNDSIVSTLTLSRNEDDKRKILNFGINMMGNAMNEGNLSEQDTELIIINLFEKANLNKDLKIYMLELLNESDLITENINIYARLFLLGSVFDNTKKIITKVH